MAVVGLLVACGGNGADPGAPDASLDLPDADPCDRDELDEWFMDGDGDGFGDVQNAMLACEQPPGFVANADDCDDTTAARQPGGLELCDGLDNDCDDATDDPCEPGCTGFAGTEGVYAICATPTSFLAAISICDAMQMDLARLDSQLENDELRAEMTARAGAALRFYAGGQDTVTENTWVWADGTHFWEGRANGMAIDGAFENWQGGEPNDDGTEDCLEVREGGGWNDVGCGNNRAYVCELLTGP